eukprot:TRINITY_DN5077_c0_g1_i1.p1 TRINITY_DN5077_c0_g1~~TRINITY_DN5077_c0_g1_i1.p1  ORF type:complete len:473 (+),score=57.49 TRINITY_DN5077_c0_g1_i1:131-1549(+)
MDPSAKKRKADENGIADDTDSSPKLSVEDARKIIQPFTTDQLLDILQNAAVLHADVLDAVRSIANRDPAQRKLFIRGLGWETTTESLRSLFAVYGDLEEAVVILDKVTGKSKGYGFVTFRHIDGAILALKEPSKKIGGRMTVTQLAASGTTGPTAVVAAATAPPDVSMRKIYVGNVPFDMQADRLLAHFSTYGEVEEGPLGFDKQTGKSRGFALFVYRTAEAARAALVEPNKNIDGHILLCKLAIDGKRLKPGMPGQPQPTVTTDMVGDGGIGSLSSQYGAPAGLSSYGGFSGGAHHHPQMNSALQPSMAAPGLSSVGSQVPSSLGSTGSGYGAGLGAAGLGTAGLGTAGLGAAGLGGPGGGYGGPGLSSQYGGPGSGAYGGPGSTAYGGPGSTAYGGPGSGGYAGLGSASASSLYRLPPSSVGMPSGAYPETTHYSLSSSGYQSQHHQQPGSPTVPRAPTGGMYQGIPPYY